MIFSRYRPDTGIYDYFQSSERVGLGDDLSVPALSFDSPIGVPSTEIGRQPRGALSFVGQGPYARGQILPLGRAGLAGAAFSTLPPLAWLGLGIALGWWLSRRRG